MQHGVVSAQVNMLKTVTHKQQYICPWELSQKYALFKDRVYYSHDVSSILGISTMLQKFQQVN